MFNILVILLTSLLWRIRGGLGERQGMKLPCNKIWFSIYMGLIGFFVSEWNIEQGIVTMVATYTSYQLYGWGKYVGALVGGNLNKEEKECELIDDILDPCHITWKGHKYYLWDYPRIYGFCGTSLSMLIVTFIIGLAFGSLGFMISGIGAGVCYWLGSLICRYIIDDGKNGWNWGEWIFGLYLGIAICLFIL